MRQTSLELSAHVNKIILLIIDKKKKLHKILLSQLKLTSYSTLGMCETNKQKN